MAALPTYGATIDWAGFAAALLLIEITPGPNMAWLAGLTLAEGRRAGLAATAGVALGLALNGAAAGLGLAAAVALDHPLQHMLRWAGAVTMLVLAWLTWRDRPEALADPAIHRRSFGAGLVLNLLNPKAFLLFILVAPPFLTGGILSVRQALGLAAVSVAIATCVHLAIVLSAARAHGWVSDSRRNRLVRRTLAVVMVGVAVWFLVE